MILVARVAGPTDASAGPGAGQAARPTLIRADSAAASCDPALVPLFAPPRPHLGRYEICTSMTPIQGVRGGAIEALEALEAFGAAGNYNRPALARLYGGTRVQVARGWTASGDRFESFTRLSPYPDASLTRLLPGTMEIRFIAILPERGMKVSPAA